VPVDHIDLLACVFAIGNGVPGPWPVKPHACDGTRKPRLVSRGFLLRGSRLIRSARAEDGAAGPAQPRRARLPVYARYSLSVRFATQQRGRAESGTTRRFPMAIAPARV
jgi:hypothetical protein